MRGTALLVLLLAGCRAPPGRMEMGSTTFVLERASLERTEDGWRVWLGHLRPDDLGDALVASLFPAAFPNAVRVDLPPDLAAGGSYPVGPGGCRAAERVPCPWAPGALAVLGLHWRDFEEGEVRVVAWDPARPRLEAEFVLGPAPCAGAFRAGR
jgi:hypothetical protein